MISSSMLIPQIFTPHRIVYNALSECETITRTWLRLVSPNGGHTGYISLYVEGLETASAPLVMNLPSYEESLGESRVAGDTRRESFIEFRVRSYRKRPLGGFLFLFRRRTSTIRASFGLSAGIYNDRSMTIFKPEKSSPPVESHRA